MTKATPAFQFNTSDYAKVSRVGHCVHCDTVHDIEDMDTSAYKDDFVADVVAMVGGTVCNECIEEFTTCSCCDDTMKKETAERDAFGDLICQGCASEEAA